MRGDFTRSTFDRSKRFSRVLKQQGRVELDSDFNEAMDILLHHQRTVASDLIGQHGTPPVTDETEGGFHIYMNDPAGEDFSIGRGKYYVDGILCENDGRKNADGNLVDFTYLTQPDYPQAPALPNVPFIVYLDVWERHITALEDDYIREKALNGPDTASRAKVVWQVKVANRLSEEESLSNEDTCESSKERWSEWVRSWRSENRGLLKAATGDPSDADLDNPCITPPEARYRGAENQLYRVEIHTSGTMGDATFKWSRDNGSMIFPVVNRSGGDITLGYLGRDSRHSIEPGQWVELVDDNLALHGEGRPLGKVMAVDRERMMVTVEWPENPDLPDYANEEEYKSKHVLLRRWDHTDRESVPGQPGFDAATGTLFIAESENPDSDNWLTLENGIRISFAKSAGEYHDYQTGDYWLIPARIATGDVEWPWERDPSGDVVMSNNRPVPEKRPPHGVEHHYAPLAVITFAGQNERAVDDCRRKFISAIDPDTDLQVHNLDVSGRVTLNSAAQPLQGSLTLFSESADVEYDGGSDKLFIFHDKGGTTAFLGGNIGMGTTQPSGRLSLSGTVQPQQGSLTIFSNSADIEYDGGDDKLFIIKNNGDTTSFQGGKVGIGATTPRNPLAIRAQGPSDELISFEAPDGTTKWHINQNFNNTPGLNFVETGAQGGDGRLFLQQGGFVGIGTTTPSVKLEVVGDLKVLGNAYKPSGGWTEISDERLKKNVKSLKGALDSLLQLRGVSFEWREPEKQGNITGTQIGMVAQDVEKVFPAWVGTGPEGMKNVTFRGFEALMVEALRELNNKIDELVHRMDAIEEEMRAQSTEELSSESDVSETEAETQDESESTPKSTGKRSKKSS